MGAQWSVYYAYSLGEPYAISSDIWEICPAVRKEDDEEFTVFLHDKDEHQSSNVDLAIKYLRTLRHPGLLKCHEVFHESPEIAIVTEAALPLADVITERHIYEVIAGIHDVIATLAFLHDKCKLSHNNLSMDSIFVGQNDACWKIAGFENMCSFSEIAKEKLMNDSLAHAKDALSLGKLICDILEQVDISDELSVSNFQQRMQTELVEASVEKRPEVRSFLNDEMFQNEYCQILDFLRNITVKTSASKATFFRTLHKRLLQVPTHLIATRLLHLLLSRFVLIDPLAVDIFLPHLLTPQSGDHSVDNPLDIMALLPEDLYRECCIPILKKLFEVNDRHVRLILLKYFHLYVGMFEKDCLQSVILPELRLGLQDSDDELVSATFSALQYLVPLVGAHVIVGGERLQQFTERRPKFNSAKDRLYSGSEMRSKKAEALHLMKSNVKASETGNSHLMTSKVQPSEGKSVEEKILERERRREETRRRNEERRKQRQKTQMERKMAMKVSVVEHMQEKEESGDDFDAWENFGRPGKDQGGEVSDDSDHGRPSSSEISIDSDFSERQRNMTEQPVSPRSPQTGRENGLEDTKKFPKGKTNFGMKLGKLKQGNTKNGTSGKSLTLKDTARVGNKLEKNEENVSGSYERNLKTKTNEVKVSSPAEGKDEDYFNSGELQDHFNTDEFSVDSMSQTDKTKKNGKSTFVKTNSGTKSHKAQRSNDNKLSKKSKKISPPTLVDKPWDEFGIKVTKKDSVVDDIFADMAPTLSETRKAPVKGTSLYSDTLAVVTDNVSEDADGWLEDDW